MQLITEAAAQLTPNFKRVLDTGCGAGNDMLKMRQFFGKPFASDVLGLSGLMLTRAERQVAEAESRRERFEGKMTKLWPARAPERCFRNVLSDNDQGAHQCDVTATGANSKAVRNCNKRCPAAPAQPIGFGRTVDHLHRTRRDVLGCEVQAATTSTR